MKIPKKVGKGLRIAGYAGVLASVGGTIYFTDKLQNIDRTSSEHVQVTEIDQESFTLQNTVFDCFSANYTENKDHVLKFTEKKLQQNTPQNISQDLSSKCVEATVRQYHLLQAEKKVLIQNPAYKRVEEQKEVYSNHALGFLLGGVVLSMTAYAVGLFAVGRRKEEEKGEEE